MNAQSRPIRWCFWFPIIFFEIYLNGTVFLFAAGPWPWPVQNAPMLYAYLFAAHLFLFAGYALGVVKKKPQLKVSDSQVSRTVGWALTLSVLLLIPTSYARSGGLLPNVVLGLTDPGTAYTDAVNRSAEGGLPVLIEYLRIFLSPILAVAFPVTVATWSERSWRARIACIVVLIFTICLYIAMGTNKAIFDSVFLLPWLIGMGLVTGRVVMSRKQIRAVAFAGLGLLVLAMIYFAYGQIHRAGNVAISSAFGPPIYIFADPSNWMTSGLPDFLRIMIESISRYLSQGYYALSLALPLHGDFSYGAGNSLFLGRNVEKIFNIDLFSGTLPGRIDTLYGWSMLSLWDSIYPWIASDVGFVGSLVVIFLIGYLFSLSWISAIRNNSPFSIALASYFIIMLFYFPANNQIMQNGESCVGFWIIAVICALRYHMELRPISLPWSKRDAGPSLKKSG
jgi:hypothetical protein